MQQADQVLAIGAQKPEVARANRRAFVMAHVLARQERRSKALRQKTDTPLNAMFRGVCRLYLLTSLPHKCHFFVLTERFSRNLVTSRI